MIFVSLSPSLLPPPPKKKKEETKEENLYLRHKELSLRMEI